MLNLAKGICSQKATPLPTIMNQQRATKKGPAAPVSQSAAASTRLKHFMTTAEQLLNRSEDGICLEQHPALFIVNDGQHT